MGLLVHTFDFKRVVITLGGVLITGFAKDSSVKIEYNNDSWTTQVGADGEGVRSKSNDFSAKVTFSLMPGSFSNAYLTQLALADRVGNVGVRPLEILDSSTGTNHAAIGAWPMKPPAKGYQAQAEPVEWALETNDLNFVHGFAP